MAETLARERPILFSGPMVRAIIDGRKTQTRRVIARQPDEDGLAKVVDGPWQDTSGRDYPCPFGVPGDRLWVREGIRRFEWMDGGETSVAYQADGELHDDAEWVWKRAQLPSMLMPRGLCRISLEVTDVRVERLQAITEDAARAEGVAGAWLDVDGEHVNYGKPTFRQGFAKLWNALNEKRGLGWDVNPWVWVVSFRRVEVPRA